MKICVSAVALLVAAASVAPGAELGAFDDSRLYAASYNLLTGDSMGLARDVLTSAGVTITLTDTVTPKFLNTVDVFFTSKLAGALPSSAEVQAMADWVAEGGVFIVTGDCT